jgi:hypothetical protein
MAFRSLKRLRNAVFFDGTETLDDLEPKPFVKMNAPFEIPARNAHMLKIINHS